MFNQIITNLKQINFDIWIKYFVVTKFLHINVKIIIAKSTSRSTNLMKHLIVMVADCKNLSSVLQTQKFE